ncbi:MAG: SPASM domain-containing protein [Prevotella bivia]|nr:SPASM domain-containing protein [Prevotella bivia]
MWAVPIRVLANSLYNNVNKSQKKKNNDFIENRVLCTANYSHLFILPDGKVTICEQLYWNSKFIVGDILESSLAEIWTSDKAKYLYNLPQKDISDESSCKTCKVYTICRQQSGGVFWKEVIAAYGTDKWDYPDPSCPHAPNIYNDIYL